MSSPPFFLAMSKDFGVSYCSPAQLHSGGIPARIRVAGSALISEANLSLIAEDLPQGQFGYFLVSATSGQFTPPGSQGVFCLGGGSTGRFNQASLIVQGPTGSISVDLGSLPTPVPVAVQPGDTWNFQCWFRDFGTSNFTDAVSVTFF